MIQMYKEKASNESNHDARCSNSGQKFGRPWNLAFMVRTEDIGLLDEKAPKHLTLPEHDGRIVIVGDIHGCCDEFRELLDNYFCQATDLLICAGDLV